METVMLFDKDFFQKALPNARILCDVFTSSDLSFSIDTRTLSAGSVYIALKGERVDGHDYIREALEDKDAAGVILEKEKQSILQSIGSKLLKNKLIVLVENCIDSLLSLAKAWRKQFSYPVIGITGSMGKTSTRELLVSLFKKKNLNYVSSSKNLNSIIGLPLSMLKMRKEHEIAVFEMGINKRGEMARLADTLEPTIGIITGVGHSHLEGLGSLNDIALEKRAIFKNFKENNIGIVNGDQPQLSKVGYAHPVIKFGMKTTNQIQARKVKINASHIDMVLRIYDNKYPIRLASNHEGAIFHALTVASVGALMHMDDNTIIETIQEGIAVHGRYEHLDIKDGKGFIINDCYNANPESMKMALAAFDKMESPFEKVAVLGDMLELGIDSTFWHRQIGRFLRKTETIKKVILVGNHMREAQSTIPHHIETEVVDTAHQALEVLPSYMGKRVALFVKGSNAVKLSVIVDEFVQEKPQYSAATIEREVMNQSMAAHEVGAI